MKQSHRTLMHFLPHILLHSLLEGTMKDLGKCHDEFMAVINSFEPPKVISFDQFENPIPSTSNSKNLLPQTLKRRQCMKVVFVLLDFLERWIREWNWQRTANGREDENYKRIEVKILGMFNFCYNKRIIVFHIEIL